MSISWKAEDISTNYISYPKELSNRCIACKSKVKFIYPSAGHSYQDFNGCHKDIIRLYICTNPFCPLHKQPFNPSPINVLPYKQYSLGVWKWIAQEAKIYKQSPNQIVNRIKKQFGLNISENTIRNCIKEIDVYLSSEIDKKTHDILRQQKKIVLALDGQKPDDEGNALWLFVDLISNRVLKVVILQTADYETLYKEISDILGKFDVELIGGVSDKQNSIVKMHETYFQSIPWQYCHFHFLQNLWNHIEIKDGNLHKKLSKIIKDLYILKVQKSYKLHFEGLGKVSVREVFHELELQLRAILKARSKKFKNLRGIEVYERLNDLIEKMSEALANETDDRRIVKIMNKTLLDLKEGIVSCQEQYETCINLEVLFQMIRKNLGNDNLGKEEKIEQVDSDFQEIWNKMKGQNGKNEISELRSFLPQKDKTMSEILQEWVRLYYSYRKGLFSYYDFPISAKTNSPMEQSFGQEKAIITKRIGKKKVGGQIRIHGENLLKLIYAGDAEVKEIIDKLDSDYDRNHLKEGLEKLSKQTKEETMLWKNQVFKNNGILDVLKKGK